jgi:hypothetical protein
MSWYDWLIGKINHPSRHLIYHQIEAARTDTATAIVPMEAGKHYFRLWLAEMYLKDDVKWFQEWYPAVHSLVSFQFGSVKIDVPNIAGSLNLDKVSAANINKVVQMNYQMTTLMPFNGGVVEITAGLLAMKGGNYLNNFIGVMGEFASLLVVPQLSAALAVAAPVANGIQKLIGNADDGALQLGLHQAFSGAGGGGANDLKSGYLLVVAAEDHELDRSRLWISGGKLQRGASLAESKPLTGYTYMLFRVESRTERDDFLALTSIADPFNKAIDAAGQGDAEKGEAFIRAAVVAALQSPDLTRADRNRVARALKDEYNLVKENLGLRAVAGEKPTFQAAINRALATDVDTALNHKPGFDELFAR